MAGIKYDMDKPDLSLCPRVAMEFMAKAFMHGEQKYGRYNYLEGFASHRLVAAALRHILAYQSGEEFDSESNVHHLGHALACMAMVLDCMAHGTLEDTRFNGVQNA